MSTFPTFATSTLPYGDGPPNRKRARIEPPAATPTCEEYPDSDTFTVNVNFPGGLALANGCTAPLLDTALCQNASENMPGTSTTPPPTDSSTVLPTILLPESEPNDPLASIQTQAHLNRLALQTKLTEGKGTEDAYTRHIKNYEKFWNAFQEGQVKENPNHHWVNAHPIIGAKVSLFLQHEITRNKVSKSGN